MQQWRWLIAIRPDSSLHAEATLEATYVCPTHSGLYKLFLNRSGQSLARKHGPTTHRPEVERSRDCQFPDGDCDGRNAVTRAHPGAALMFDMMRRHAARRTGIYTAQYSELNGRQIRSEIDRTFQSIIFRVCYWQIANPLYVKRWHVYTFSRAVWQIHSCIASKRLSVSSVNK